MKKIIFVDDEQNILEGLRNLLRPYRKQWDMSFALGGKKALELLGQNSFDVIVTDMRMPEMDGAEVLQKVKAEYPHIVRIVLSGYTELEAAMRAVPVAHQFLTKPCDAELLLDVVNRACCLQALIGDKLIRKIVGKLNKLPPLPKTYSRLVAALGSKDVNSKVITSILEQDMSMCAKILQLVNSSFFRTAMPVTNIEFAVTRLGFETIKNLVLGVEIFEGAQLPTDVKGFSIDNLQANGQLCATIARKIFSDNKNSDDAFMVAILHDIGELVLAIAQPRYLEKVYAVAAERNVPIHVVEMELSGVTHAEVGAYLLGLWGLPYPIVEAVANHHTPNRVEGHNLNLVSVSYLSSIFAEEIISKQADEDYEVELDADYLDGVGVTEAQVLQWREFAALEYKHAREAR